MDYASLLVFLVMVLLTVFLLAYFTFPGISRWMKRTSICGEPILAHWGDNIPANEIVPLSRRLFGPRRK